MTQAAQTGNVPAVPRGENACPPLKLGENARLNRVCDVRFVRTPSYCYHGRTLLAQTLLGTSPPKSIDLGGVFTKCLNSGETYLRLKRGCN
jgi:hypothetical protein